jgi:hypothetical protein
MQGLTKEEKKNKMNLTVKLEFLDASPCSYSNPVNIFYNNRIDEHIGYCEISMDNDGRHYGQMELSDKTDMNLYLYYANKKVSNPDVYPLDYLSLHDEPRKDVFTKTLKEMIV